MSAGQLRIIKGRIKSVENTKKITKAMEMVSAAKLRRFQKTMAEARPFTEELERMLANLVRDQRSQQDDRNTKKGRYTHPFLQDRGEERVALVLMTSDSGLCGPYNMELIEMARDFIQEKGGRLRLLYGVGKAGISALKRDGHSFEKTFTGIRVSDVEATIKTLKEDLEQCYLDNRIDAVYTVYGHFGSASTAKPAFEKILPFKQPEGAQETAPSASSYIYEPSPEFVFGKMIPVFFEAKVRMLLLEAFVSEHMARMNAMHQATKNAKEMIDSLVLFRNKVRQAIITKEIIEIISGSQASRS